MGLAEGFASGFSLVDAALQRRQANETAAQRLEQDRADHAEEMQYKSRDMALKESAGLADAQYKQGMSNYYSGLSDNMTTDNKLARETFEESKRHSAAQDKIGLLNAGTGAAQAQSAIDEHKVDIETKRFELEAAKQAKAKAEALQRIQTNIVAKSDGTGQVHIPAGEQGEKFFEDFKLGTGNDIVDIAGNFPQYKQAVEIAKVAVTNPQAFANNKQPIIDALNVLEKNDINKGLGKQSDGTYVSAKEVSNILYHEPQQGYPQGFYSFSVKSFGTDKDGNYMERDGDPVTQYRSSSPYDNNVRIVTPEQLTRRVIGHEAITHMIESSPEISNHLTSIYSERTKDKKVSKEYQLVNKTSHNTTTGITTEEPMGAFNKDDGSFTPYESKEEKRDDSLSQWGRVAPKK